MVSPKNPISAIFAMIEVSTDSSRSHWVRCGTASRSRKSRARSRNACCSAVRVRSMTSSCRRGGQVHEYGERGPVRLGGAEQQRVGLGPLEVQVRRVLPRHADTTVQL